jgi:hypothetical protein
MYSEKFTIRRGYRLGCSEQMAVTFLYVLALSRRKDAVSERQPFNKISRLELRFRIWGDHQHEHGFEDLFQPGVVTVGGG